MAESSTDSTEVEEELNETEEVEEQAPAETEESDQAESTEETEETDETEPEGFKQRYTQFKGESPEEYAKNLEEGYNNSSKEAVKLAKENKDLKALQDRVNALIATNPDLAAAINGTQAGQATAPAPTPATDPGVIYAQTMMQKDFEREYNEFAQEHPEIETDPLLAEQVDQKLASVRDAVWANEKRMVGMGEGLKMAWAWLGKDDTQEKVRMAAKDQASSSKSASGVKKGDSKPKFTEDQINVYMDMSGASRADAIKTLSEYAS